MYREGCIYAWVRVFENLLYFVWKERIERSEKRGGRERLCIRRVYRCVGECGFVGLGGGEEEEG